MNYLAIHGLGHLRRRLISASPALSSISCWTLCYLPGKRPSLRPLSRSASVLLQSRCCWDREGLCSSWKVILTLWEGPHSLLSFPENEKCKTPHLDNLITARPSLYKPPVQSLGFCRSKTKYNPHSLCYTDEWLYREEKRALYSLSAERCWCV